jgi:hypothetical protein
MTIASAPSKTSRLTVRLKEMSIGSAMALLNREKGFIERDKSLFIEKVTESLIWHQTGEVATPQQLTVQERIFIEGQYLSMVGEHPNFAIGHLKYADFFTGQQHEADTVNLGHCAGDDWAMCQITGDMAEGVEAEIVMGAARPIERFTWILGFMAASLYRPDKEQPPTEHSYTQNPKAYGEWLEARMQVFEGLPESTFLELFAAFIEGLDQLAHLFNIGFDDHGIVFLSKATESEREAGNSNPIPARFRRDAFFTEWTLRLGGQTQASTASRRN